MNRIEKEYDNKIYVSKIINSNMADDNEKGDKVFNIINEYYKKGYNKLILDFEKIELVNTAFLNNSIGKLFDPESFKIDECRVIVRGMDETMVELLRESIRVARQKFSGKDIMSN